MVTCNHFRSFGKCDVPAFFGLVFEPKSPTFAVARLAAHSNIQLFLVVWTVQHSGLSWLSFELTGPPLFSPTPTVVLQDSRPFASPFLAFLWPQLQTSTSSVVTSVVHFIWTDSVDFALPCWLVAEPSQFGQPRHLPSGCLCSILSIEGDMFCLSMERFRNEGQLQLTPS